ncbi:MAG: hypothetical protein V1897_01155 [Pseudomonadota bacterium]
MVDSQAAAFEILKLVKFDWNVRLGWIKPPELVPVDVMVLDRSNPLWSNFLRVEKVNKKKI